MKKYLFAVIITIGFYCSGCSQEIPGLVILPGVTQIDEYFDLLKDKNVAFVANQSSTLNDRQLIDTLLKFAESQKLKLSVKKVFSPEHGYTISYDAGSKVEQEKIPYNSIEVVSLYGNKIKPSKADLAGIDIIVFDLQDVGVRFYTYLSTLHYIMQACAENSIPLIVLDRPNPNASYIDGPVLTEKYKSFVGLHPVPVVYGMTMGEYALMLNGEKWLGGSDLSCKLTVILNRNYRHTSRYHLSMKPSPNLPDMQSIYLYPGLCFFEGTVMSVGRGTDFPFQVVGHPNFPTKDFQFIPVTKTGASSHPLFEGEVCYGIDLRKDTTPVNRLDIEVLIDIYLRMNLKEKFFNDYFDLLAGNDLLRKQIISGKSADEIRTSWQPDIENFKKIRAKYLLYPD